MSSRSHAAAQQAHHASLLRDVWLEVGHQICADVIIHQTSRIAQTTQPSSHTYTRKETCSEQRTSCHCTVPLGIASALTCLTSGPRSYLHTLLDMELRKLHVTHAPARTRTCAAVHKPTAFNRLVDSEHAAAKHAYTTDLPACCFSVCAGDQQQPCLAPLNYS